MNAALFRRTWRAQQLKLLAIAAALIVWGAILPFIFSAFGKEFQKLVDSGIIPEELMNFGGGSVFSLAGSVALGFIHPITVALLCVFAVGLGTSAVAGERQRGTLEVLLARPISRRGVYGTLFAALVVFIAILVAAELLGTLIGSIAAGVIGDLEVGNLPLLWLNGVLLYVAFAGIALAASVSSDRLAPALGITLAFVLVSYFLEVIGSLWPDAAWLQKYSLFHYLPAQKVLTGTAPATDLVVLAVVAGIAVAYALWMFPRRDIAAPS